MSSFENLRVVDNFYQTSLFFPMPTVVISTLCEDGSTTLGPYSLVQPYYVAGKDFYAMLLSCRNSSNNELVRAVCTEGVFLETGGIAETPYLEVFAKGAWQTVGLGMAFVQAVSAGYRCFCID